jgi:hypothetical protein
VEDLARQRQALRRHSVDRVARGLARQLRLAARVRRREAELQARLRVLQAQPGRPTGPHARLHVPRLQPGPAGQQASAAERPNHVHGLQHRIDAWPADSQARNESEDGDYFIQTSINQQPQTLKKNKKKNFKLHKLDDFLFEKNSDFSPRFQQTKATKKTYFTANYHLSFSFLIVVFIFFFGLSIQYSIFTKLLTQTHKTDIYAMTTPAHETFKNSIFHFDSLSFIICLFGEMTICSMITTRS